MGENLAYQEERREERIDGKVVLMAPASMNHNRVVRNISRILDSHLQGRTCEAFTDGAAVYLTEEDFYIPDVMVVCDPSKVQEDGIHGAPDLVVEILSPSTATYDRGRKKDMYEKCGVREYWIVNPADKTVEQYFLRDGRFSLHETYAILPDWMLSRMRTEDLVRVKKAFQCSLYDDLVISLEDIFARVP